MDKISCAPDSPRPAGRSQPSGCKWAMCFPGLGPGSPHTETPRVTLWEQVLIIVQPLLYPAHPGLGGHSNPGGKRGPRQKLYTPGAGLTASASVLLGFPLPLTCSAKTHHLLTTEAPAPSSSGVVPTLANPLLCCHLKISTSTLQIFTPKGALLLLSYCFHGEGLHSLLPGLFLL